MAFTDQPSCPPSLGTALLSAPLVRTRSTLGRGSPPGIFRTGVSAASALGRPVANLRYYAGSDSCRRSPPPAGLPAYLVSPSCRSTPNHVMPPVDRFTRQLPASTVSFRLRRLPAGSPRHPAETGSLSCGPTVRLRLLPTPPHDDAVTFGYGASAYSDTDFHRADETPSRAHWERCCAPRPATAGADCGGRSEPTGSRRIATLPSHRQLNAAARRTRNRCSSSR
jgi:hypothetical protein